MSGHWAESIVNNMGSRFIINGVGNDKFNPNGKITGAEFTAIIVNALGLSVDITRIEGVGASDQKWYAQFLAAAEEYGLFAGTDTVKSKPMEIITREQALTIISNAIAICNQKVELSEGEGSLLSKFSDQNNISDWARGSIEICLKTGIVVGRGNGEIAPKDNLTRAETAAIIQKFLQQMGLVDK
ncbi:MAG: hypothetical protein K0R50_4860 [Eubacterium sp.]|nr:hypothetical protein [Eubacterium sp.]